MTIDYDRAHEDESTCHTILCLLLVILIGIILTALGGLP